MLSVASASALPSLIPTEVTAGDTINFTIDDCDPYLTVNITPCEPGEWKAENCTEDSTGNFTCECNGKYILNLTPAVNSIGTFEILITYSYYTEKADVHITPIGGWGGGWVCRKEGQSCYSNTSCCKGLICVQEPPSLLKKCIKPIEPIPEPEEPVPECTEGQVEKYVCPDATEVDWCECVDENWSCIEYPEDQCPELPEEPEEPEEGEIPWWLVGLTGGSIGVGGLAAWKKRKKKK